MKNLENNATAIAKSSNDKTTFKIHTLDSAPEESKAQLYALGPNPQATLAINQELRAEGFTDLNQKPEKAFNSQLVGGVFYKILVL